MANDGIDISSEIIKRIAFLKQNYENYCKENHIDCHKEVMELLTGLTNYIEENYKAVLETCEFDHPCEEYENNFNQEIEIRDIKIKEQTSIIEKKEQKIGEQRDKIKDLRKQKKEAEAIIEELQQRVREIQKLLDASKENLVQNESMIANLKMRIYELEERIKTLQHTKAKLESKIHSLEETLDQEEKIKREKEELLVQKKELEEKLKLATIKIQELERLTSYSGFGDRIDEVILEQLYTSKLSMEEIQSCLEKKHFILSFEEIKKRIHQLSLKVFIATSFSKNKRVYFISPLPSVENIKYDLDLVDEKDYIDFLFVADHHIYEQNIEATVLMFDSIINFCMKNGIKHVIHLGDVFDFNRYSNSLFDFKKLVQFQKTALELIQKIPKEESIQHIILGGNHDAECLNLGVDFLKYFIGEREEFSLAGYQNSLLKIIHNDFLVGNFLLSHPYHGLAKSSLKERILNFEQKFGCDIAFAFFGHHHASYLDLESKGCIVPSLSIDRICNGAWFVRLNLKENQLENMIFKPLVLEKKLVPVSEFIYSLPK